MSKKEWTKVWHNARLDIELLRAYYVEHAFPRHSHDYYVITIIKRGLQSFTHQGRKYFTPPGGVILINPGEVHTGEAADERGFEMLCLYPTTAHMQNAAWELTGRHQALPYFKDVRTNHPSVVESVLTLHQALTHDWSPLECETRFTWTLVQLIKHCAKLPFREQPLGQERKAIRQARHYIEERFAQGIDLTELAAQVFLSPYYLLRVFREAVGMPPHAYQESVRIRQAQKLIKAGKPLAEVALEVGYSSQSHLTHRFKQVIGVTPGQYAQQHKR